MDAGDLITAALILAGTFYLLYRSLFRKKGGCHGCSGDGCGRGRATETPVVRLGVPPRPHDEGHRGASRCGP